MALAEILVIDERLREIILDGTSTDRLQAAARESGMTTLRQAGLQAVYDGHTTVEEVIRETMYR
jgi:type IV pilus assembly protein PilB